MKQQPSRRAFLRNAGVGLLGFMVAGRELLLTPVQAREADVPLRMLNAQQAKTLEAFGEILLSGSSTAGLVHFLDHQLGAPAGQQMLMINYLGVEAPFLPFYTKGLEALDAAAGSLYGTPFNDLEDSQKIELTRQMSQANPDGWDGPPAPLFYFVVRSDAVDVVYGTKSGVERLGLPYMAHIEPPSRWGE